jgi:hypothetical protein
MTMEDLSENIIKEAEETIAMEDLSDNVIKEVEKAGEMQPMKVKTEEEAQSSSSNWGEWLNRSIHVPRRYKLIDDKDARQKSILTLQFAVMVSAIITKMLNPNYAIMASPGLNPDSFPDTDPFNFNYFLPMMSLLGVAIASLFLGTLSDRAGRKRIMLILAVISGAGSIAKYFARETFWGFCITQLVFGFFLGNLPIAMAYVGDVFTRKQKRDVNSA